MAAGSRGTLRRHIAPWIVCAVSASVPAEGAAAIDGAANVERIMAETCAVRGLALKHPVAVRPMTAFQGGYTAGVGSVSWEERYAEQWRAGWCALGVYCVRSEGQAAASAPASRMARPAGLYDRERNVLFIREAHAATTIAHETVHALQFQNNPAFHALHPWHNRDLAAAVNTALEGDAHLVGQLFDRKRRLHACSMAPRSASATRQQWWEWTPNALWAHEGLPHVFGPGQALQRALDGDGRNASVVAALDAWLRDPPLSTLAVLRQQHGAGVDFIALPDDILDALGERRCERGLENTAGALGIWGLLVEHGDAGPSTAELPEFLHDWRGDRFLHMPCDGDANDELAWVTRWTTRRAAREFANRYEAVAAKVVAAGGVLGAVPSAVVRARTVALATPGLRQALPALARSRARTFAAYGAWIDSGCFPQDGCASGEPAAPTEHDGGHVCAAEAAPAPGLRQWLDRVRLARGAAAIPNADAQALLGDVAQLAAFCARNGRRNPDLMLACRAAYGGVRFHLQLRDDAHWRLLPYCADGTEMREWVRETYYGDSTPADVSAFAGLHGLPLAAKALAEAGADGLEMLATRAPLSTRQILAPSDDAVAFIHLPSAPIENAGCERTAEDVRGALGIWNLLLDHDTVGPQAPAPAWLRHWRGDRRIHIRCSDGQGWIWVSRWRDHGAARTFATAYNAIASKVQGTAVDLARADVDGNDVWILPVSLEALRRPLREAMTVRTFHDMADWAAAGCFPQPGCS